MSSEVNRTPSRLLILGCTSFAGFDSVSWDEKFVPNIPDYDLVIISAPHITEKFLKSVDYDYLRDLRHSLIRLLNSGGNVVALVSANIAVDRNSKFPDWLSSNCWCPVAYETAEEAGQSIVQKQELYTTYLKKMFDWSFYLHIPSGSLTRELTDFYGPTHKTKYRVPFNSIVENRYQRVLAGQFHIEVRHEILRSSMYGSPRSEFPVAADVTTGTITLLPLINRVSPEEALTNIIQENIGSSLRSPEPDWAQTIEMPHLPELVQQVQEAESRIEHEKGNIMKLNAKIDGIRSFRCLLYGTGSELESIVKHSLEKLGAVVSPSKYGEEEYILEYDGEEFPMEVKGVSKSITLTHLRQLADYMMKYQEETGKECKGILFGNSWRNLPPEMRGGEDTPEFPDNVVKRAEQLGISLVSAKAFFEEFVKILEAPELSEELLKMLTGSRGLAFGSSDRNERD